MSLPTEMRPLGWLAPCALLMVILAPPAIAQRGIPAASARLTGERSAQGSPDARLRLPAPDSGGEPSLFDISIAGIAGGAIPVGDFAELSGGAAKPGFLVGAEVNVRSTIGLGWLTSVVACVNGVDTLAVAWAFPSGTASVGTWATIWMLTGFRYEREVAESIELFGSGQIGLLHGISPDVSGGYNVEYGVHVESESSTAFAYGAGCGILFSRAFYLQGRFVHGTPKYRLPFSGPPELDRQSTSLLWITAGLVF